MRYQINFDKLVNKLVSYYLGGRKLILYLQALLKPLQATNELFHEWAIETRIEASMTSQVFKFEWFLNRRFSKYFVDPNARISISNGTGNIGTPMYDERVSLIGIEHVKLYKESENGETTPFYKEGERTSPNPYSFIVSSPVINDTISQTDYLNMLRYQIDKYKLAGKTYKIIFNETL